MSYFELDEPASVSELDMIYSATPHISVLTNPAQVIVEQ